MPIIAFLIWFIKNKACGALLWGLKELTKLAMLMLFYHFLLLLAFWYLPRRVVIAIVEQFASLDDTVCLSFAGLSGTMLAFFMLRWIIASCRRSREEFEEECRLNQVYGKKVDGDNLKSPLLHV